MSKEFEDFIKAIKRARFQKKIDQYLKFTMNNIEKFPFSNENDKMEECDEILIGKSNKTFYWAGLELNNLEESIINVYKRGELAKLRNFNSKVREFVEPHLIKSKELNEKTGMDKFL